MTNATITNNPLLIGKGLSPSIKWLVVTNILDECKLLTSNQHGYSF
ncbi:MAG: hypothetical protein AB4368_11715 [Xenococcaceae cyanobacterium]